MAKKITKKRGIQKLRPLPTNCPYCKEKREPDYKNYEEMGRFLTDRAKILAKTRTGICTKHQRGIAVSIKRARHLGLLPFTGSF